jgi:hypothetical protein
VFDWLGAFVIVAVTAGVWRYGARARGWAGLVARLPETRVAELSEGKRAKVVGVVEAAAATMPAPLTQRPCVGWTIRTVAADGGWVIDRVARSGGCDFWLRDADGGRVLVHGGRAAVVLATGAALSAAREQGLVQREAIFAPGDRVIVVGMVRRELDPGGVAMYRDAPTRLSLDGIPLWILPGS